MLKKYVKPAFSFLLGSLALVLLGVLSAGLYLNSPTKKVRSQDYTPFVVEPNESLIGVALDLESQGLIRTYRSFVFFSSFFYPDEFIQSGSYRVGDGMSSHQIFRLLIEGRQALQRITLPEGLTARQMGIHFERAGVVSKASFLRSVHDEQILARWRISGESAEGFLFPDTYFFPVGYPAGKVVNHLIENFFKKVVQISPHAQTMLPEKLFEKVIMASIVERESKLPQESPVIAGVFYNRLKLNMRLEANATISYVITEKRNSPYPEITAYDDLWIDSPYNTYRHRGFPPGPIANPGEVALRAAFYPVKTDYLYFVVDEPRSGSHAFSVTFEEHKKAIVAFRKRRAQERRKSASEVK